ncbi:MAG: hypothetical protein HY707_10135 [Ignavibacteriae bacterium]|nr:hypothetical protein [Ignavibacteriota bacterium]
MKTCIIIIVMLLIVFQCSAQVSVPRENQSALSERSVYGVGFSAGLVSGFGLSFRHHFPYEFSYQLVGGIISVDRNLHYNLSIEAQYDLAHSAATRFFAGGGVGFFYSGESGHNNLSAPLRVGVGIGGEWVNIFSPVHLTGEILFTYFSDGTVLPLPQASVHYYFF